jgi:hypothetical protein
MGTHADTCCAGANWALMDLTGDICEVTPFLESYEPVNEVPVWTSPQTGKESLLVADQMLWFGTQLPNSLLNPNQLRAFGVNVNDNPFDLKQDLGIQCNRAFIPCDMLGTIMHFESRVLTKWEMKHLPMILLTGDQWDPLDELMYPERKSREYMKMRTIQLLTSGMTRCKIMSLKRNEAKAQTEEYGEVEHELGKISSMYSIKNVCECLIGAVNIAMTYCADIDKVEEHRKVAGVITNDLHSNVTPKELSRKWNIGIQTAKDTLGVTTQHGV